MQTADLASKVVPLGILESGDILELFTYIAVREKGSSTPLTKKWNTTKRKSGLEFKYVSDWDTNGILYWLGSEKGTSTSWNNPYSSGKIAMANSQHGGMSGSLDAIVARSGSSCWIPSTNYTMNGNWFTIDFKTIEICPNYYTLRDSTGGGGYQLRNWNLEGSRDGSTWEIIRSHVSDTTISSQGNSGRWPLTTDKFYRHLRVITTNYDASGTSYFLFCSGFEVYGTVSEL